MNVERVPPVPLQATYTIELTTREAEILRALVGGVNRLHKGEAADFVISLYRALTAEGIGNQSDETFSDLFSGAIACK